MMVSKENMPGGILGTARLKKESFPRLDTRGDKSRRKITNMQGNWGFFLTGGVFSVVYLGESQVVKRQLCGYLTGVLFVISLA